MFIRNLAVFATALLIAGPQASHSDPQALLAGAQYYASLQQARDLAKTDGAKAVSLYEQLTRSQPDDVEVWLEFAQAASGLKSNRQAAGAYEQALQRGGEYNSYVAYQVARSYALAGDKEKALSWLEKSLAVPLEFRSQIAGDDAFSQWRSDPKFRQLAGLLPENKFTRDEGWRYDLDFLQSEMRRMYFSYRKQALPAELQQEIDALRPRIPQLSDDLMLPEIQKLVARLGDGHSLVMKVPKRVPLTMYQFSDGVFITDAPDECHCIGDKVLSVGPTAIDDALHKIEPFLSVDNPMGYRRAAPVFLHFPDYLVAAGIVPSSSQVSFSLQDHDGAKRQYVAKPEDTIDPHRKLFPPKLASRGAVPRYLQHVDDSYWFETLDGGRTVYFQFNQVLDKPGESIEQFAPKLRTAILAPKVQNLIIDVRHNNGGNLSLFRPLLRAIIAFQETREKPGIYLLTGRMTFSAAQVFTNSVDYYTSAVVAGEPAGSRPNFVGEGSNTTLPYSGLRVVISTRYHQTDDQDERMWIVPKIPVQLSSADYFSNRDPVMEAVLQVIAKQQ